MTFERGLGWGGEGTEKLLAIVKTGLKNKMAKRRGPV